MLIDICNVQLICFYVGLQGSRTPLLYRIVLNNGRPAGLTSKHVHWINYTSLGNEQRYMHASRPLSSILPPAPQRSSVIYQYIAMTLISHVKRSQMLAVKAEAKHLASRPVSHRGLNVSKSYYIFSVRCLTRLLLMSCAVLGRGKQAAGVKRTSPGNGSYLGCTWSRSSHTSVRGRCRYRDSVACSCV